MGLQGKEADGAGPPVAEAADPELEAARKGGAGAPHSKGVLHLKPLAPQAVKGSELPRGLHING